MNKGKILSSNQECYQTGLFSSKQNNVPDFLALLRYKELNVVILKGGEIEN